MDILPVYKDSFFCGFDREDGLRLKMMYEKGVVYCNVLVDSKFEGYTDVLHGGMIFGILDVIIWYAIFMETKKICMTRHVEMDFIKPVMCNSPYIAKGQFLKVRDKDFYASARMEDINGECYAKVDAIFREAKDLPVVDFINRFDFSHASPEIRDHFLSLMKK